jgi:hypothetical protein
MYLWIYLAVVVVAWAGMAAFRGRQRGRRPRLGDRDAYDGNLIVPPPGSAPPHGRSGLNGHGLPGGHDGGHIGHTGGHIGGVGGHH